MQDYREKRNYPRMQIDCPARFEIVGGAAGSAVVKNLSGGGLLVWVEQDIAPGEVLQMKIKPTNDITPPMVAQVNVLRSTPVGEAQGSFAIACQISRVLG